MSDAPSARAAAPVTVVIPTKNRAELLAQTLRSVREQTRPPERVIVADDGSTDHTAEVVDAAGAERIENPRGDWGAGAARNAAVGAVTTDFVAFVDSDDLMFPRALEALVPALAAAPAAPFAYGTALVAQRAATGWTAEGVIAADPDELRDPLCSLFSRNSVPSSGALVRTTAMGDVGGYDESLTWAEDHHLWVRLALTGAPAHVDELVCVHRRHTGNRHTPRVAQHDADATLRLAAEHPELGRCLPGRLGVELCEVAISTLRERPRDLPRAVRRLLPSGTSRRAVVRRSARHWRARRRWAATGTRVFYEDADMRGWLARY